MPRTFYLVIAVQAISALADNALLIVAIARLYELAAANWLIPLLKLSFVVCYVFLAPFIGHLADAWNKGRVMMVSNNIKACAAFMLMLGGDPIIVLFIAGLGAALYAPAKYGIITEMLPAHQLVKANGFIEGSVVCAVIAGTVLGGFLVSPALRDNQLTVLLAGWLGTLTTLQIGMLCLLFLYLLASVLNLGIEHTGVIYPRHSIHPLRVIQRFIRDNRTLWNDRVGGMSMSVTTILWGVGASLQLIVIRWAGEVLDMGLDQAAYLQGFTALGVIVGALIASRYVSLEAALRVLPLGFAVGLMPMLLAGVHTLFWAVVLLIAAGALLGLFLVPMNALLQHRGHSLLTSGRSIAVQGFNENFGILVVLSLYALATSMHVPIQWLLIGLALLVLAAMALIIISFRGGREPVSANQIQD